MTMTKTFQAHSLCILFFEKRIEVWLGAVTMTKRKAPKQRSYNDSSIEDQVNVGHERNKKQRREPESFSRSNTSVPSPTPLHPSRISICRADHDRILSLLKMIDWDKARNTSRKNVIRSEDPSTPRKGKQPYCQSFIFGRNMKDPQHSLSWWSIQYPHIYEELQQLIQKYNPHFTYTHITLNKNLRCKRHTDGGNAGLSYIIGLGTYTGGELQIESPDGATIQQDLHRTFVLFNGKTQPHETLPFTGDRFTLVYYTSDMVPKECTTSTKKEKNYPQASALHQVMDHVSSTTSQNITIDNVSASIALKFKAIKNKLGRKRS